MLAETLGYIGGSIVSVQGIPQLVKVWRSRSSSDLSYTSLMTYFTGGALLVAYGILIEQPPVYATVSVSMANTLTLMLTKLYFEAHDSDATETTANGEMA